MGDKVNILIIEDSLDDTLLVVHELRRGGFDPTYERVATALGLEEALGRRPWDVVISDFRMPGFGGMEALEIVKAEHPDLPFIVVSGTIGEESAVDTMRAGAQDYVMKNNLPRLALAVRRELQAAEARREAKRVEQALRRRDAILDAVRFAADQFLLGEAWDAGVPAALARLGKASETQRAAIFENLASPAGSGICLRFVWTASDLPTIRVADSAGMDFLAGLERWPTMLAAGEILHGPSQRFPPAEAEALSRQGLRSLVVAPVFVGKVWWGFLRLDDIEAEREWHPSELDAIRAAARMLGAAIHQKQSEDSLRDSHRRLQAALAELEASQRQVVQRERLAAVGQLAAGIAHDFNNTLAVIQLYGEMLYQECDRPQEKARVETILSQARRAATLTQQIVDFSRRTVLSRRPLDLVPFLKEFAALICPTLPKNIHVTAESAEVNCFVRADAGRLQQVFLNLATNARDAMPQGGRLLFRADRLTVESGQLPPYQGMGPGDWVTVRVTDTGTGIEDEVRAHLFEPFFTTKGGGRGTGLGLAQVYGIIRQHDGFIDVETRKGEGTTFLIYLPRERTAAATPTGPLPRMDIEGRGETVLIVEDDPDTRRALCEILQTAGYKTLHAGDGQEALGILRSGLDGVDIVLSDLVMPSLGGVELYRIIRQERLPVRMILATGHPLGERGAITAEAEALSCLQKPFTRDALLRKMRTVLDS